MPRTRIAGSPLLRSGGSKERADSAAECALIRNFLTAVPKAHQQMAAALFWTIFAQPGAEAVDAAWEQVRDQFAESFPKPAQTLLTPSADRAVRDQFAESFPKPGR